MRVHMLIALGLLSGCGPGDTGIWAMYLPAESVTECETLITHNFTNAYEPEGEVSDDGDWTITEERAESDSLSFVQIETFGNGEAILFIGATAYPGVATDSGWNFSWEGLTESESDETHTSGYSYTTTNSSTSTFSVIFNIDGDTASGTIGGVSDSQRTWVESDTWDPKAVGFTNGQIPSQNYLLVDNDKQTGLPAANQGFDENCSGDCSLDVFSSCMGEDNFTASRVHYADESVYEFVDEAGQGPGF